MAKASHLTEEQFARYRSRTLSAVELLGVDDHIACCSLCRDRMAWEQDTPRRLSALRDTLSEHLVYDEIAACVAGTASADAVEHMRECTPCREEVDDLRQFQRELETVPRATRVIPMRAARTSRRGWYQLLSTAAIVVLMMGAARWYYDRYQRSQTPSASAIAPKATETPLTAAERQAVQLALVTRKLERAPILDSLISKREVLLGGRAEAEPFDLLAPLGTAVVTDRPVFRWDAVPGASSYVVAVFDEDFRKVSESPAVSHAEWQPATPLARGRIYNWQVTATAGGKTVRAPIPPAPQARFQVAGQGIAEEIETARREHPSNHLLLAVLLAKAGAIVEAAQEVDALAATDAATAKDLRDSVAAMRKP